MFRRTARGLALLSLLSGVAAVGGTTATAEEPLVLVSARPDGVLGTAPSGTYGISLSADGRAVAFASAAPELSVQDGDAELDVFVRDLVTGTLVLASITKEGHKAKTFSLRPSIDDAGSRVAFTSASDNLDPGDSDGLLDVFVKDLRTGDLALASTTADGSKGTASSSSADLSGDGRRVAFVSSADELSDEDADRAADVFVKDLVTGALVLASGAAEGAAGQAGPYGIGSPSLSADGSAVAFDTDAALVQADTDEAPDVYVKDLRSGALVLASVSAMGRNSERGSYRPSLSADGRRVAFDSFSADLSPDDLTEDDDVFVKDLDTGGLEVASTTSFGEAVDGRSTEASLSADGRRVAFSSDAALGPVPVDALQTWVKDLDSETVDLVSTDLSSQPAGAVTLSPRLSGDGRTVAFATPAALLPSDGNGWADVYARRLAPPPPPPDLEPPRVELAATPDVITSGVSTTVTVTGSATDSGSGVASVTLDVTDEYGLVDAVLEPVVSTAEPSVHWTRTLLLSGRVRARDTDGRRFSITATATDLRGNTARTCVEVVARPRRPEPTTALAGGRAPSTRRGTGSEPEGRATGGQGGATTVVVRNGGIL